MHCHFLWQMPFPCGIINAMRKETLQIDRAGRVVLPKPLRDRFRLNPGDTLAIQVKGDAIELRPVQPLAELKRVNGVLVLSGHDPLPNEDFAARSRDARIDDLLKR
jgi:AbrB family looped-hinge helix DNA binding protein